MLRSTAALISLVAATSLAAAQGVLPISGAYCSTDPEYQFRITASALSNDAGACEFISAQPNEDILLVEMACDFEGSVSVSSLDFDPNDPTWVVLSDGHEYELAPCPDG